jgi:hypothetical protein
MVPLMLAMRVMLPPFPNRRICLPTAWAVKKTPSQLTFITCDPAQCVQQVLETQEQTDKMTHLAPDICGILKTVPLGLVDARRCNTEVETALLITNLLGDLPHELLQHQTA